MFERVPDRPFEWIAPPEASFLEISDWGIDAVVTRKIEDLLGPRYRVQAIDISHQDFDTWTNASITRHIRELPLPETPIDADLLVLRDWRSDAIGKSDHAVGGLGLYRRDFDGGRERLGVFASYRLVLADPDTGAIIAEAPALLSDGSLPWLSVATSLWPRTQNEITDAQRRVLRSDFLNLIDKTLPGTLDKLRLGSSSEPAGKLKTRY
ncbi:MAG TPA: hypothetical protein VGL35_10255 [Rhizomicrobium sp.]